MAHLCHPHTCGALCHPHTYGALMSPSHPWCTLSPSHLWCTLSPSHLWCTYVTLTPVVHLCHPHTCDLTDSVIWLHHNINKPHLSSLPLPLLFISTPASPLHLYPCLSSSSLPLPLLFISTPASPLHLYLCLSSSSLPLPLLFISTPASPLHLYPCLSSSSLPLPLLFPLYPASPLHLYPASPLHLYPCLSSFLSTPTSLIPALSSSPRLFVCHSPPIPSPPSVAALGLPSLPPSSILLCSLFSGAMASILTQPADVIKTHMQLKPDVNMSIKNTVMGILQSYGVRGLFAGLTPRVTRRTLMAAFTWTFYEQASVE